MISYDACRFMKVAEFYETLILSLLLIGSK